MDKEEKEEKDFSKEYDIIKKYKREDKLLTTLHKVKDNEPLKIKKKI